ncbi:hypothetical protein ZIOFF_056569 [Zingiber officinale]|uniref:Uncharacterized protein n=1 Tax=Zingiber officinale TaxID=94328 RepID=A0A8J5KL18_ZINOF|nr:hypothetical protein ZIOFF_056569 [Zingiber officinale]
MWIGTPLLGSNSSHWRMPPSKRTPELYNSNSLPQELLAPKSWKLVGRIMFEIDETTGGSMDSVDGFGSEFSCNRFDELGAKESLHMVSAT